VIEITLVLRGKSGPSPKRAVSGAVFRFAANRFDRQDTSQERR